MNENSKVTLILPVRRYSAQVIRCLKSILAGTVVPEILVMDCTAEPGALDQVRKEFPQVRVFDFKMNPGRAHAVNTGIHLARTPYVMTFSPHLEAGKHCVERLCGALEEDGSLMSAQARILSADEPARISGAGWGLTVGAHPVVRGKGAGASYISPYAKRARITAAQMDAAVYRMEYLEVTGILDERYYGWLEDLDLGCRGILCGFNNLYEPQAVCREIGGTAEKSRDMGARPGTDEGSGTDCVPGSSRFYRQLETGNMIYFRYKFGMGGALEKLSGLFSSPDADAAVQRGRIMCFQAEMECMERDELGMSVTKQTLPEEFCLKVREDGPVNVYPLYLGERVEDRFSNLAGSLRVNAAMLTGTGEKILGMLRMYSANF